MNWNPATNKGGVEFQLQNGEAGQIQLDSMNEFLIVTQLLLHPNTCVVPDGAAYRLVGER